MKFDQDKHEYSIRRRKVPGVTGAIRSAGLQEGFTPDDWYSQRGNAVHKATALDDLGTLDESSVSEVVRPFLECYRAWKKLTKVRIEKRGIEKRLQNPTYGFCGTLDRIVKINGVRGVLDIKTGSPDPWHRIQTAGYALCFPRPMEMRRWALYLKEDGPAKLVRHPDETDLAVFLSSVTIANFKHNVGKENGRGQTQRDERD